MKGVMWVAVSELETEKQRRRRAATYQGSRGVTKDSWRPLDNPTRQAKRRLMRERGLSSRQFVRLRKRLAREARRAR